MLQFKTVVSDDHKKFAHAPTAVLLGHVQTFVMIWFILFKMFIKNNCDIWRVFVK